MYRQYINQFTKVKTRLNFRDGTEPNITTKAIIANNPKSTSGTLIAPVLCLVEKQA